MNVDDMPTRTTTTTSVNKRCNFFSPPPLLLPFPREPVISSLHLPGYCGSNHQVPTSAAAMALQPPMSSRRRSADSSPSHSHSHSHSRNSSRKSNNSVNCKLDGKRRIRVHFNLLSGCHLQPQPPPTPPPPYPFDMIQATSHGPIACPFPFYELALSFRVLRLLAFHCFDSPFTLSPFDIVIRLVGLVRPLLLFLWHCGISPGPFIWRGSGVCSPGPSTR